MTHAFARAVNVFGLALVAHGCAIGDGGGFARLEPGTLRVGLEISPARRLSDTGVLTNLGHRIELEACSIHIDRLELQQLTGSSSAPVRFDPAKPPAGYTSCHGGHCHSERGELVTYEEVQAEQAGATASWEPVATAMIDRTFDLLRAQRQSLHDYAPMPELPRAVVGRAALFWNDFRCSGTLEDEASDPARAFAIDLSLASETTVTVPLDVELSRDGPETVTPRARLALDGTLFDGLELGTLAETGELRIDDAATQAATATEQLFEAATLTVSLDEED